MALVLPNQGLVTWLTWLLQDTAGGLPNLVFTLWANDIDPDQDTTLADLDRCTFGGFMEQVMFRSDWVSPSIVDDKAASSWKGTPTEWTVTGDPETVYGWAAYNPGPMALMIVERFDVPRELNLGDTIKVLPRFTLTTAPDV